MELMRQLQVMEQEKKKEEDDEKQSNHLQELEKEIDDLTNNLVEKIIMLNPEMAEKQLNKLSKAINNGLK